MINALFVFLLISSVSFTSLTKLTKINRRELNFFRQGKPSDEMISNAIKRLERYSKENDIIYNVDVKSSKLGGLGEFANKDLKVIIFNFL